MPAVPREGHGAETVVRVDAGDMDRNAVDSASLLVLDHPGTLSEQNLQYLAELIRRGKGMLYVACEPQDAANLARLGQIAGSDLKMPVEFSPPPENQPRKDLFLLEWRKNQSPFDQLDETASALAGSLRFNRGLASHPAPGGLADDVLATYSDRSACLIVTPCGIAGEIAVLNADLTVSNLPGTSLFAPMIEELCNRLLAASGSTDALACGEPMAVVLPTELFTGKRIDDCASSNSSIAAGCGFGIIYRRTYWRSVAAPGCG